MKTFSRVLRIGISRTDDHAFDPGGDDGVCARRRATVCAAWFKRDEELCAARILAALLCVAERLDFRVRQTRAPVPAAADDFSVFHQYGADHRIWRRGAEAAPGKPESKAHESGVRHPGYRNGWLGPRQNQMRVGSKQLVGGVGEDI